MNLVIFGPPEQEKEPNQNLLQKFNFHQISTGELLRNEIKKIRDRYKNFINY